MTTDTSTTSVVLSSIHKAHGRCELRVTGPDYVSIAQAIAAITRDTDPDDFLEGLIGLHTTDEERATLPAEDDDPNDLTDSELTVLAGQLAAITGATGRGPITLDATLGSGAVINFEITTDADSLAAAAVAFFGLCTERAAKGILTEAMTMSDEDDWDDED